VQESQKAGIIIGLGFLRISSFYWCGVWIQGFLLQLKEWGEDWSFIYRRSAPFVCVSSICVGRESRAEGSKHRERERNTHTRTQWCLQRQWGCWLENQLDPSQWNCRSLEMGCNLLWRISSTSWKSMDLLLFETAGNTLLRYALPFPPSHEHHYQIQKPSLAGLFPDSLVPPYEKNL
jgi:hypothetical protein